MLSLAAFAIKSASEPTFDIDGYIAGLRNVSNDSDLLPGDSAQFSAGVLFQATGRLVDKRDDIVACSQNMPKLDDKLAEAFYHYTEGDFDKGSKSIEESWPLWQGSLEGCDKTINDYFT